MTDHVTRTEESASVSPVNVNFAAPTAMPSNGLGTSAGVLGIVGIALFWVPFLGGVLTLLALVLGASGLVKANREVLPKGMAITGLVLGAIGTAIYVLVTFVLAASVGLAEAEDGSVSGSDPVVVESEGTGSETEDVAPSLAPERVSTDAPAQIKDISLQINGISTSSGGDMFAPDEGSMWLIIDATFENHGTDPAGVSTLLDLSLSDENGRSFDQTILADTEGSLDGDVLPGRKLTGQVAYEVPVGTTYVELVWQPLDFFDDSYVIFEIPFEG